MKGKLTGVLLLVLSIGLGLNLTASFRTICSITFEECCVVESHDSCCAMGCCEGLEDQDCCLVLPENVAEFVMPSTVPPIEAPFLADVPFYFDFSCPIGASQFDGESRVSPDPPPRSGRVLLSLIERCLI